MSNNRVAFGPLKAPSRFPVDQLHIVVDYLDVEFCAEDGTDLSYTFMERTALDRRGCLEALGDDDLRTLRKLVDAVHSRLPYLSHTAADLRRLIGDLRTVYYAREATV